MMRTMEIVRTAALVLLALAAAWMVTRGIAIETRLAATDWIALLRVFISWPVLVGVFLFVFRRQIATILLGIRRVSREGIEFEAKDQQAKTDEARRLSATVTATTTLTTTVVPAGVGSASPATTSPGGGENPLENVVRALDSPFLDQQKERIMRELAAQNATGDQAISVLVRQLAAFEIGYTFEALYSFLWGSQLAILQYLAAAAAPVAVEQVRPFYAAAAQRYPTVFASYPFENYLGFMRGALLVNIVNNTIAITPVGREFLAYLVRVGRPLAKPQ